MNTKYTLVKRPTSQAEKDKKAAGKRWKGTYYVRWKQADGTYSTAQSTGKIRKDDAEDWCAAQLSKGGPAYDRTTTIEEYGLHFFDWPDGRYALDKKAGGHRVSYRSAQAHRLDMHNHLFRIIGKETPLSEIDRQTTKKLRDVLFTEKKAANTINHIVNTLSVLLQAAEEDEIIPAVPRVYRAGGSAKSRGVLTLNEARTLFAEGTWFDAREKIANELAAATGCRQSEILSLQPDRVTEKYIDIRYVWDWNAWELKDTTKNGDPRIVPISPRIHEKLTDLILDHPHKTGMRFVFYDDSNPAAPYDGTAVTKSLYSALTSIGIAEEERKRRRVVFHSWRHFANSLLVDAGIPETTVRAMVGHHSQEMTMNYYHPTEIDSIIAVQMMLE